MEMATAVALGQNEKLHQVIDRWERYSNELKDQLRSQSLELDSAKEVNRMSSKKIKGLEDDLSNYKDIRMELKASYNATIAVRDLLIEELRRVHNMDDEAFKRFKRSIRELDAHAMLQYFRKEHPLKVIAINKGEPGVLDYIRTTDPVPEKVKSMQIKKLDGHLHFNVLSDNEPGL